MQPATGSPAAGPIALRLPALWAKLREECTHIYETFMLGASNSHGSLMWLQTISRVGIHPRTSVSFNSILTRLHRGNRWWAAEFVLRAAGLGIPAVCALMARTLDRLANQPPPHDGTLLEFVLGAVAVVSPWAGLALLFEGPRLFRLMPKPPRALF
jgi:hypothetical protein